MTSRIGARRDFTAGAARRVSVRAHDLRTTAGVRNMRERFTRREAQRVSVRFANHKPARVQFGPTGHRNGTGAAGPISLDFEGSRLAAIWSHLSGTSTMLSRSCRICPGLPAWRTDRSSAMCSAANSIHACLPVPMARPQAGAGCRTTGARPPKALTVGRILRPRETKVARGQRRSPRHERWFVELRKARIPWR